MSVNDAVEVKLSFLRHGTRDERADQSTLTRAPSSNSPSRFFIFLQFHVLILSAILELTYSEGSHHKSLTHAFP
jgi:hypothetical protein